MQKGLSLWQAPGTETFCPVGNNKKVLPLGNNIPVNDNREAQRVGFIEMSQWATLIRLGFGKPNGLEKWYLHPKD